MEEFDGKNVKVVYDDNNRIVTKTGKYKGQNDFFILIINSNNAIEAISISKIIRMEVV